MARRGSRLQPQQPSILPLDPSRVEEHERSRMRRRELLQPVHLRNLSLWHRILLRLRVPPGWQCHWPICCKCASLKSCGTFISERERRSISPLYLTTFGTMAAPSSTQPFESFTAGAVPFRPLFFFASAFAPNHVHDRTIRAHTPE